MLKCWGSERVSTCNTGPFDDSADYLDSFIVDQCVHGSIGGLVVSFIGLASELSPRRNEKVLKIPERRLAGAYLHAVVDIVNQV